MNQATLHKLNAFQNHLQSVVTKAEASEAEAILAALEESIADFGAVQRADETWQRVQAGEEKTYSTEELIASLKLEQ